MIRKLLSIGILVSLGACSAMPSRQASSSAEPDTTSSADQAGSPSQTCDSAPVLSLVGKTLSPGLVEQARTQSHSAVARVVRPGEVMTMEYNPARLNLIVGKEGTVITIHCG